MFPFPTYLPGKMFILSDLTMDMSMFSIRTGLAPVVSSRHEREIRGEKGVSGD